MESFNFLSSVAATGQVISKCHRKVNFDFPVVSKRQLGRGTTYQILRFTSHFWERLHIDESNDVWNENLFATDA